MRLNRTFLYMIAPLALLSMGAAPQTPQATAEAKSYLLRYRFTEGKSHEYEVEIDVKAEIDDADVSAEYGSDHSGHVEGENTLEISAAKEDTYELKILFRGKDFRGTGIFEDAKEDLSGDTDSGLAKIDNLGNLLGPEAEDTDVHLTPVLPEGPVKVGDTWDATSEEMTEGSEEAPKVTGKLARVEIVNGKELLRLEYEGVDLGFGPSEGPVVVVIDAATGLVHSFEAKFKDEDEGYRTEMVFVERLKE